MKKIAVITILICSSLCLIANDTTTYKNNIDLSLSSIKFEDGFVQPGPMMFLQLNYNRNINDLIGIGGYGGYGWYEEWIVEKGDNFIHYTATDWKYSIHYGLNCKLHILPLILNTINQRFDVYLSGDIGLISMFTTPADNISPEKGTYFDYSLMGGASIFLSKKLGLFVEAGYREFKYHQGPNVRFGLTYRF